MPSEAQFQKKITSILSTQYGGSPRRASRPHEMEFVLPQCRAGGGELLRIKYTESFGDMKTLVLEMKGFYGLDNGLLDLDRRTIMDVKQLIPWDPRKLYHTLDEWFVRV